MKSLLTFLVALCPLTAVAQQQTNVHFRSPIDYDMKLAGNFCEPRPDHFHCGIDVKTQGVQGKAIYAIGDGYVSRITVGYSGFGLALYVTHPSGFTSVYCHLRNFTPAIEAIVKRYRYANETYDVDIKLAPAACPVRAGQLIAYSGNSGSSLAPHLHLELWRDADNARVDPLPYFKNLLTDNTAPRASGLMLYPKRHEGVLDGGTVKRVYTLTGSHLAANITAWGWMGAGIWANDYMDGTNNHFGVWRITLAVDGREVFRSQTDEFMPRENRLVNSWGDFEVFKRRKIWYLKAFAEPGNTLSMLKTDDNRGWVNICEERDYNFEYTLTDYFGNTRQYTFTVSGRRQEIPAATTAPSKYDMHWNQANILQEPGMELDLPRGVLPDDITLNYSRTTTARHASDEYTLHDDYAPLSGYATLMLAPKTDTADPSKLYIAARQQNGETKYIGGTYADGWLSANVSELGRTYFLEIDTVAPTITPIQPATWMRKGTLRFTVSDVASGIKSYKGYVDGQFVLFDLDKKTLTCKLSETPLRKTGKSRTLELHVTDKRGNERVQKTNFVY